MATYYWVGGTGTWDNASKTNWSTVSGGAGGSGPPLATDNINFDANSGTGTCTTGTGAVCQVITFNTSTLTLKIGATTSTSTFNFTAGSLDLNNNILNITTWVSNNTNTRSIAFGSSGTINVSASGVTVWLMSTTTGLSITGTSKVNFTYSGATGTRVIQHGTTGGSAAIAINMYVTAGSDTVTVTGPSYIGNYDFTGFSGTLTNRGEQIYGDIVFSSTMTVGTGGNTLSILNTSGTQKITSNGKTIDYAITVNNSGSTFQLQDSLNLNGRQLLMTAGTLDLAGNSGNWTLTAGSFSSSNSNTRVIKFGTGNITLTGSGTVWNTGTVTNFSYTGTPTVNVSNNSATATTVTTGALTEAQALTFNYTVGTYTLTDTSAVYKSLNFTGFTGTVPNSVRTIYGSLTIASGATNSAGTNATTFAGTSGTQQITTNAVTLNYPLTFNGVGGTFAFQDALTQGSTRAFTVTNGTVKLKASATSVVGSFVTSGTNQKYLQSTTAGTQATLSQASGVVSTSYLTIQDINATGGATWDAFYYNGNLDNGNNTNWIFGESPVYGTEYEYRLRSFTEPRRF